MSAQSVYLDTSAVVKRYMFEEGSEEVDELYRGAHAGEIKLAFSMWNVGEAAVVLAKYERKGVIKSAKAIFEKFLGETKLLTKLGQLKLIPLNPKIIIQATSYVFKHGVYLADAIQIASAQGYELFLTYDKELARVASLEGLRISL